MGLMSNSHKIVIVVVANKKTTFQIDIRIGFVLRDAQASKESTKDRSHESYAQYVECTKLYGPHRKCNFQKEYSFNRSLDKCHVGSFRDAML